MGLGDRVPEAPVIYARKWAELSADGAYRWILGREWSTDSQVPWMHFVMLNPSKADGEDDDPTIRKCVGFAQRSGCRGMLVTNLSAYRATDPRDLISWVKASQRGYGTTGAWGIEADQHILDAARACRFNVIAWGANARHPLLKRRASDVLGLLREHSSSGVTALKLLADGVPWHPLMLSYSQTPTDIDALSWGDCL